jgi:hypothetical protein
VALVALVLGGCISRGEIRIGRVHVHDPATTKQELAASGKRVSDRVRTQALPGTVQESFGASELHSARLSLAAQPGAAPGAAPPEVPAPLTATTPELPAPPEMTGLNGTVGERIDDILRHEGRALELELIFSGAGNPGGFWIAAPNKLALIVPQAAPGGRTSHVSLELTAAGAAAKNKEPRVTLGSFDYTERPR